MLARYKLTLIETSLDEACKTVAFTAPVSRVCYVANGDATLSDERMVQRFLAGQGGYAHGTLIIKADVDATRVWVWELTAADHATELPPDSEIKLAQVLDI